MPTQSGWRFCDTCFVMFFGIADSKGICFGGGGHTPQGFDFVLAHDVEETANADGGWRFCNKSFALFRAGLERPPGQCPSGDTHNEINFAHPASGLIGDDGFHFVLPHDVAETADSQGGWGLCQKCHAMFFDGSDIKGICSDGGGHSSLIVPHPASGLLPEEGFDYVIPHAGLFDPGAEAFKSIMFSLAGQLPAVGQAAKVGHERARELAEAEQTAAEETRELLEDLQASLKGLLEAIRAAQESLARFG